MKRNFIITLSFLIAILLEIMPLPQWADWLRPEWLLVVLIFWLSSMPQRIGVGVAFIMGLIMDILQGNLLGENALLFVLLAYMLLKFYPRMRLFPVTQQVLMILIITFIYKALKFSIQAFLGQYPGTLLYWLPAITTAVVWPWLHAVLRKYQQRERLYS